MRTATTWRKSTHASDFQGYSRSTKQMLYSGVVSSSVVAPIVGEESQPVVEANFVAVEIAPSAPSFVLAKRKQDDSAGPLGHKKLKAPSSLRALRQAAGLTLDFGHP